jgi:hypothetical protein
MNTDPRAVPGQKPYYHWDDLKDQVSLHNGTKWLDFHRASLASDSAKLLVVRQLLEDNGIDKAQISMLLQSLDSAE